jgi:hypothetical protein
MLLQGCREHAQEAAAVEGLLVSARETPGRKVQLT